MKRIIYSYDNNHQYLERSSINNIINTLTKKYNNNIIVVACISSQPADEFNYFVNTDFSFFVNTLIRSLSYSKLEIYSIDNRFFIMSVGSEDSKVQMFEIRIMTDEGIDLYNRTPEELNKKYILKYIFNDYSYAPDYFGKKDLTFNINKFKKRGN